MIRRLVVLVIAGAALFNASGVGSIMAVAVTGAAASLSEHALGDSSSPVAHFAVVAAHLPTPRNRLIGPGLNVGVSIYSDCTGRTELTRQTIAIDTCVKWDIYFVGHSYGGPFTSLTRAYNGETFTWYNKLGVARRFTIKGHQFTYAYGPADIPPRGTAAQFQTCLTPNGSRIITFYAVSP
jgi:hypothetical protein